MEYVGNRARSLADKAAAFGAADRGFKSHRARLLLSLLQHLEFLIFHSPYASE